MIVYLQFVFFVLCCVYSFVCKLKSRYKWTICTPNCSLCAKKFQGAKRDLSDMLATTHPCTRA